MTTTTDLATLTDASDSSIDTKVFDSSSTETYNHFRREVLCYDRG